MSHTATEHRVTTAEPAGKIDWFVEQRGGGPDIVLIPSGEGDCASFERVASELSGDFRVTSFDTPGFSRTVTRGDVEVSMVALGRQVASLIGALGLETPTIYGCSSGGVAALDLAAAYPGLVRRSVVHEAALPREGEASPYAAISALDDAGISAACADLFATRMNEKPAAWRELGPAFHDRLRSNYPRWFRSYVGGPKHPSFDPAQLAGKPITWTIGGLSEVQSFFSNVRLARRAGIELDLLPCRHFPQVSIPMLLAEHIRKAAMPDVPQHRP